MNIAFENQVLNQKEDHELSGYSSFLTDKKPL
uniref:Uncharacterized protein n=1 Tax=Rhizophora mucronata TaxID=61149 RepID=A0A2P2J5M6_RHIMU